MSVFTRQNFSRRRLLQAGLSAAGGLAIAFHLPTPARAAASDTTGSGEINAWLAIEPDDSVIIRVAKQEMGQGVWTSMPMIIAEELEVDFNKVKPVYASANRSVHEDGVYQRMGTGGSGSVRGSRAVLQQVGASARERLIRAGANAMQVDPADCRAENGQVVHKSGKRINYGAIASAAATITLEQEPAIKTPDRFKLLGTRVRRLDVPAKTDGSARFGMDVRVPGMLYAAVMQSPVFGGTLKGFEFSAIKEMPGVVTALPLSTSGSENAVAVVADTYWRAKTALDVLPLAWNDAGNGSLNSTEMFASFRRDLDEPGVVAFSNGDANAALKAAAKTIEADYEIPYLAHACMEPLNCTAHVQADRIDVWLGTQGPDGVLSAVAELTGMDPKNVHVHNQFLGGGFGRRSQPDEARQAVQVAKAVGKPVQVIWSREEDTRQGRYRPMAVFRFNGGIDKAGKASVWHNRSVTHSIIAGLRPDAVANGLDQSSLEVLANLPYAIPHQQIEHKIRTTPVTVWFWRSVGASQNGFVVESFVDELAHLAQADPLTFRLDLLQRKSEGGDDKTLQLRREFVQVLEVLKDKSQWGRKMPEGSAQGLAITESFGTICGQVAEVSVSRRGEVRVERIICALDCGHVVNALTVETQVESSVVYGLTAALFGEITIRNGRAEQGNFDTYPMLRINGMPQVETHLALSGGEKWGGIGEPALPPLAQAVTNAIFRITGKRVRRLPLSGQDLSWS